MGNKIYTIGREFGSGGKEVGEKLAERLGIKLYDKELLQQAAKESGFCEEIFEKMESSCKIRRITVKKMRSYPCGDSADLFISLIMEKPEKGD